MNTAILNSEVVGRLRVTEDDGFIVKIEFLTEDEEPETGELTELLEQALMEIDEYLVGERRNFTFPIRLEGTEFQIRVWKALLEIPYGETISYKELAERVDNPNAVRAVGGANNKNKLPIIIPCHRVIGSKGNLVGYAGGIDIKERLLMIERKGLIGF